MGKPQPKHHIRKVRNDRNPNKEFNKLSKEKLPKRDGEEVSTNTTSQSCKKRPEGISDRFDTLFKQKVGSLVVAQLNVNKIGKTKRRLLSEILNNYGVDCLAVVEHHLAKDRY